MDLALNFILNCYYRVFFKNIIALQIGKNSYQIMYLELFRKDSRMQMDLDKIVTYSFPFSFPLSRKEMIADSAFLTHNIRIMGERTDDVCKSKSMEHEIFHVLRVFIFYAVCPDFYEMYSQRWND